jgi:hypothetical protein
VIVRAVPDYTDLIKLDIDRGLKIYWLLARKNSSSLKRILEL